MVEVRQLKDKVLAIVADAVDRPVESLTLGGNLFQEFGLDSLGAVAIFVELHAAFGIPEPKTEEEFQELDTVEKLIGYVANYAK